MESRDFGFYRDFFDHDAQNDLHLTHLGVFNCFKFTECLSDERCYVFIEFAVLGHFLTFCNLEECEKRLNVTYPLALVSNLLDTSRRRFDSVDDVERFILQMTEQRILFSFFPQFLESGAMNKQSSILLRSNKRKTRSLK